MLLGKPKGAEKSVEPESKVFPQTTNHAIERFAKQCALGTRQLLSMPRKVTHLLLTVELDVLMLVDLGDSLLSRMHIGLSMALPVALVKVDRVCVNH